MAEEENKKEEANQESEIGRLHRQLYERREPSEFKRRRRALSPAIGAGYEGLRSDESELAAERGFTDVLAARTRQRRKIIKWVIAIIGLGLLFGGAAAATLWYRVGRQVELEQVKLSIEAPESISAGDEVTYQINYGNTSRVALEDLELIFTPPPGFRYAASQPEFVINNKQYSLQLGRLQASGSGQVTISGRLLGEKGVAAQAQAELLVTPENFPGGRFVQTAVHSISIASVPLEVSIEAATEAAHGERVLAKVRVRNLSGAPIEGAYLKTSPSEGIQLGVDDQDFSPDFSVVNSEWQLPQLDPLTEVERQLVMFVEGRPGERRNLLIEAGVQAGEDRFVQRELNHVVTITESELSVEQLYNGSADPQVVVAGQEVEGLVRYQNVGNVGITNVIVKVSFEGVGLNPATLDLPAGAYDPIARTITWSAATVPGLATLQPQQLGELKFSFEILETNQLPKEGEAVSNLALVTTATIDSPDLLVPVGTERVVVSDRAVLSLETEMTLGVDSFYDDGRLDITSTGPLPPEVGEETTYTVRLRLGSTLNNIGDVRVTAVLPDGVRYTDQTYKTGGEVSYNERTGEVVWSLPQVAGLTGRTSPPQELHFQVAITPGEHQRGGEVQFLNRLMGSGTDLFTDQTVTIQVDNLPTTETASPKQGKVE